ncbi:hypothetical protein DV737_g5550, partial [Chaetothyriales sp. CBS 132003]
MALIEGFAGFMPSVYKEQGPNDPSMGLVVPGPSPHKRGPESTKPVESHSLFVAIFLNEDGVLQTRCSAAMRRHERHILEDAYHKFKDVVENFLEQPGSKGHSGLHHPAVPMFPRDLAPQTLMRKSSKRRFSDSFSCLEQPMLLPSRRKEALRQSRQSTRSDRIISLRIDDKDAQAKWFSDAFKAVQQVMCRTIAKVWIKKIHPKKARLDPRTALLVHLIMNTPQQQIKNGPDVETPIYARDLLLALEEKKADFKGDRWQIVAQIVDTRTQIENYEMGGFDNDTVVFVPDFSESLRQSKSEAEADVDDADTSMPDGELGPIEEDVDDKMTTAQSPQIPPTAAGQTEEMQANNKDFCGEPLSADRKPGTEMMDADDPGLHGVAKQGSFVRGLKVEDVPMQVQRYPLQEMIDFHPRSGLREGNGAMSEGWLHHHPSPPGFMPPAFGLNGGHMLAPDGFALHELSPVHADQPMPAMALTHGLSTCDGVAFQGIANSGSRPMPARAMSTGYPGGQPQNEMHGLDLFQQSYFAG